MKGYGLCPDNPVVCGRGPAGEKNYLRRLRCPLGKPVSFTRTKGLVSRELAYRGKLLREQDSS
jgi:hypothetical protein